MLTANKPASAPLQFVCPTCWYVFNNEALPACEGCGAIAPEGGFPTMPYEFWQYLFVEQLGRGGMGAVFRAYDRRAPDRPWVAVKVAQLHGTAADRAAKERAFAREVRAAAALSEYGKYFVGFRAADYNGTPAYLALDFIDWPTLKKLKAQSAIFAPGDVAKVGTAILRGIRWMERKNIVHRDLKPENIFVRRSQDGSFEAKIADLGIWVDAGATDDSLWRATDAAPIVGSPSYMSPEQTRGEALTTASDVHAIGSILWELAAGALPYPLNRSLSLPDAIQERHDRMRWLPARPSNMPEDLYWILSTALQFEASKRVFTDAEVSHSPETSIARWMEKALEKFASDHAEQQRLALAAALDRLEALDRSIASSEAKLTPATLLAERVKQTRLRISHLRADTIEPSLPDAVSGLSSEVDVIAQEIVQLFEDREARLGLARAQEDLARERSRALEHGVAAQSQRPGAIAAQVNKQDAAQGAAAPRRRNGIPVPAAVAIGVVAGFVAAYALVNRGQSTQMTALPAAAASVAASARSVQTAPASAGTTALPPTETPASTTSTAASDSPSTGASAPADDEAGLPDAGATDAAADGAPSPSDNEGPKASSKPAAENCGCTIGDILCARRCHEKQLKQMEGDNSSPYDTQPQAHDDVYQ